MPKSIKVVIINDEHTQASRELAEQLQALNDLDTPYTQIHVDNVRDILPGIRATPAVGILLWVEEMQEAVAIADVVKTHAYVSAQGDITSNISYMPDDVVVSMPVGIFDTWEPGKQYYVANICPYNGQLYRVEQEHVSQAHQPPGSTGMLAIYRPIMPEHAGTLNDPIPYVYGMDCYQGKYYSYNDKVYLLNNRDIPACIWHPGQAGVHDWQYIQDL